MLPSFYWIWSEDGSSAIAVPGEPWEAQSYQGHPPGWDLQIQSPRLPSDKESFLQRETIPRHPHAFEPLFVSLRICRPDFDFSGINLITQLNNLRKLFRYVRGKEQDAFRIRWWGVLERSLFKPGDLHVTDHGPSYKLSHKSDAPQKICSVTRDNAWTTC